MLFRLLFFTLFMGACGGNAQLRGQVVDIWGNPIEGATVKMEGHAERPMTNSNGWFNLPDVSGEQKIKAGREGYIEDEIRVTVGKDAAPPILRLYPRPEKTGFFVVGSNGYEVLQPEPVKALGNEIKAVYGVKTLGDTSVDGDEIKIVYHTELRLDQVMTLEPEFHKLSFKRDAELHGALSTEVRVNLWVSEKPLETVISPLKSRTDYLITTKTSLESGAYALTTYNLLNPSSDEAFDKIAKPLRLIFPVELR
jgi:hypothetical protein